MKRVVIESPFAGDIERNLTYARMAMRDSIIKHGEAPIASHLLYTQPHILKDDDPGERKLGIKIGFEWGDLADTVVFYTDCGWSLGMLAAKAYWQKKGKTIIERQLTWTINMGDVPLEKMNEFLEGLMK